jgi:hypothetical protein
MVAFLHRADTPPHPQLIYLKYRATLRPRSTYCPCRQIQQRVKLFLCVFCRHERMLPEGEERTEAVQADEDEKEVASSFPETDSAQKAR